MVASESGTTDNPFLFDFISYVPDASTILDNATVWVDASDSQYDSRWNMSDHQADTSVQGASMTFGFVGAFPHCQRQVRNFKYL